MRVYFALLIACFCLLLPQAASASVDITAGGRYPKTVSSEELADAAVDCVHNTLAEFHEERRYTLDVAKKPRPLQVPEGEVSFDVTIPNGLRYSTPMPVYVLVKIDGSPFRRTIVHCKVHVFEEVVVAAKHLQSGRPLEMADVRLEEREIGNFRGKYLTDIQQVLGREVNRLVREGTILLEPMVQYPVVVESGMPVTIVSRMNGVEVRTEGIALQRGRTEEVIRVRNALTKKVLRAKVIDKKTVEVL